MGYTYKAMQQRDVTNYEKPGHEYDIGTANTICLYLCLCVSIYIDTHM